MHNWGNGEFELLESAFSSSLFVRILFLSLKIGHKKQSMLLKRSFDNVFWSHCHLFGIGSSEVTQRKMRFHSSCWGSCPKAHSFMNQMLCRGATVLQTKGCLNRLFQETRSIWLIHDYRDLSMCMLFVFKLQLLCEVWEINRLSSFSASFPKDAKRTVTFWEQTFFSQPF